MVTGKSSFGTPDPVWEVRDGSPTFEAGDTIIKIGKSLPEDFKGSIDFPWAFEIRVMSVLTARCFGFSTEAKAKEAALYIFHRLGE